MPASPVQVLYGFLMRGAYTGWYAGAAGTALVAGVCRPRAMRGKRTSLDLLRGFCCSYDIPSCCAFFFFGLCFYFFFLGSFVLNTLLFVCCVP
jgi:hypothetical protein